MVPNTQREDVNINNKSNTKLEEKSTPLIHENVSTQLSSLHESINSVQSLFEERFQTLLYQKQSIESLLQELQRKEDNYRYNQYQKGIILDIITIIDNVEDTANLPFNSKEEFKKSIERIRKQLIRTLLKCGVEELNENSKKFDQCYQNVVESVTTDDLKQDDIVIQTVRSGYKKSDGIIIRPQNVIINKFSGKR